MLEVILGDVFKVMLGPGSSPKVDFFDILKSKWPRLNLSSLDLDKSDHTNLEPADIHKRKAKESLRFLCSDENSCSPRDDYDELLKLSLFYLERQTAINFAFRCPATQHRARWMSTPIYTFKWCLLRSQLDLDADLIHGSKQFGDFVSIFYAPYWLQCPSASEAAVNDLEFYRTMINYIKIDEEVAEAARHALPRHLWYLTAELIPLALCSTQLSCTEHEKLAFRIYKSYQKHVTYVKNPSAPLTPEKPVFPDVSLHISVSDLVGERSVIIFQRLNLSLHDISFLAYSHDR